MPNFIIKIFFVEFLSNFKVAEPELKLELGDLARGGSEVVSPSEPPFGRPSYWAGLVFRGRPWCFGLPWC